MNDSTVRAILGYLHSHFGNHHISQKVEHEPFSLLFLIEGHGDTHQVRFARGILETHTADELPHLLDSWNFTLEVARAKGLPLVVDTGGIRLETMA